MPHKYIKWAQWVEDLAEQDPCLGRIVKEAIVAREVAETAGAATKKATRACRSAFESAEQTLDTLRLGRVAPNTDVAWKRGADALRKFTKALDCVSPKPLSGVSSTGRKKLT